MVKVDPRLSRFNFNGIKWQNPSSPGKSYASKSMADGYDPVNHASWGFDMFWPKQKLVGGFSPSEKY